MKDKSWHRQLTAPSTWIGTSHKAWKTEWPWTDTQRAYVCLLTLYAPTQRLENKMLRDRRQTALQLQAKHIAACYITDVRGREKRAV